MKLSKNFTLEELTHSNTAIKKNINNEPSDLEIENLQQLTDFILQPLRDELGAIRVMSGYRSKELNAVIGGVSTSQHCIGMAADLKGIHTTNKEIFDFIVENLEYDQIIAEFDYNWIHVSYNSEYNRKEKLEAYKLFNGKTAYKKI